MSCKKERNNDSEERDQGKIKNEKNSGFVKKEILEKNSVESRNVDKRNLVCTNNPTNIKPFEGFHDEEFIDPNVGVLCEAPSPSKDEYEEMISFESVGFKDVNEELGIKEAENFVTQLTDDSLKYKILEIVKEFQEKCVPFKEFLILNVKTFLSLKESGVYNTLIEQYRSEKGSNKLILVKGYRFTNPFKTWVDELDTSITEALSIIEKNFEILKYVVYFLIEGSEKENLKIRISELSKFIGVGSMMVRKTAILLGDLKVIDYTRNYGIESVNLRDVTKSTAGTYYHLSINYLLTTHFKIMFQQKIYSEPYILKPLSSDHPDFLMILNSMGQGFQDHFRNEFDKKNSSLINFRDYRFVILDFTTFISTRNIKNKLEKYFPQTDVLFLIVGIGLDSDIMHKYKNVLIPYNVKIISPDFFCRLIQLDLPKNEDSLILFNRILKYAEEHNIDALKDINRAIKTDLYNTTDLMTELGTKNLSEIFSFADTSSEFLIIYMGEIKKELEKYGASLNLPPECIETAKNLIVQAKNLDIIGINYDPIGYVGAALYLSSRFLLQKFSISQEMIYANLKITNTPLRSRMSELTQNDEILFNILFNASINQILNKLDIISAKYKDLAMKIIKLAFEKIYKVHDRESAHKEPIVITATAIYLAVNNLGMIIQQDKIAKIIGFTTSAIYYTLIEFKAIENEFKKLNIELVDPIGKKRLGNSKKFDEQIISVLKGYGELTTKQILVKFNEDPSKERNLYDHLNSLTEQGILRKRLVQIGSSLQARWKIKDFSDKIVEILEKEWELSTIQLLSKLNMDISRKGYLEEYLSKLVEDGIIKNENNLWKLIRLKGIDEEITDLLKIRGKLNTLQIISKLKHYSPNTLRPHLYNLAKLGIIRKYQRREGKISINYWECLSD